MKRELVHPFGDLEEQAGPAEHERLAIAPLYVFPAFLGGSQPDFDAFIGGVQLGIAVALVVAALLGGLSIVRRVLGA